jgi:clan AA aspartic protease
VKDVGEEKEAISMGHAYVKARFYNPFEYAEYTQKRRKKEDVRAVEVDALVDTGATFPALPQEFIKSLGLSVIREEEGETAEGKRKLKLTIALVEIEDRTAACYTIVRPQKTTPLIGVVALEQMGYRVDPTTGKLLKGLPLML